MGRELVDNDGPGSIACGVKLSKEITAILQKAIADHGYTCGPILPILNVTSEGFVIGAIEFLGPIPNSGICTEYVDGKPILRSCDKDFLR